MATGFTGGLLQGAALGALLLAALSLVAPQPVRKGADTAAFAVEPATQIPEPEKEHLTESESTDVSDVTRRLDLPAGSEFGRGGDLPPLMPEPLPALTRSQAKPDAPAIPMPETVPAIAVEPNAPVPPAPASAASAPAAPTAVGEQGVSDQSASVPSADTAASSVPAEKALQSPVRPTGMQAPNLAAEQDAAPDLSMIDTPTAPQNDDAAAMIRDPAATPAQAEGEPAPNSASEPETSRSMQAAPMLSIPQINLKPSGSTDLAPLQGN